MREVQALGRGFAPGEGREPVQVVARDIELAAGCFQRAQLAQLLLCAYGTPYSYHLDSSQLIFVIMVQHHHKKKKHNKKEV